MNRYQSQLSYGALIIITGVIVAILSFNPSQMIQYVLAAGIFLSAILAFITAAKAKGTIIPMKYNLLQGTGMLVYALIILIYGSTQSRFNTISLSFLLFFGLSEILFGFELMSYKIRIRSTVIVFRMLIGFLMAIGAVAIFSVAAMHKNIALLYMGVLVALGGTTFIWFSNVTKKFGKPY